MERRAHRWFNAGNRQSNMRAMPWAYAALTLFIILSIKSTCASEGPFDVREHLSSTTRYDAAQAIMEKFAGDNILPPPDCMPVHLNLVARHGTRAPTKKRIKELDQFAERMKVLAHSSPQAPAWMKEWSSPWKGRKLGGELLVKGEEEMFELGKRVISKFPMIFKDDYHPDLYLMSATQVPRSAASAVAFGMGLFAGKGTLGPGLHRAFSVISDSRLHDIHLRFFESCQTYKESKTRRMPAVSSVQEEVYAQIAVSLMERFELNVSSNDVSTLWFLCKQEAAVLDIVDQACALFTREEVELLEWADDILLHHLKGYGESINYRMGVRLLMNVFECMERAISGSEGAQVPNSVERAHLRFAHAETLIPFICLLGLFLDDQDMQKIQRELPLEPPVPPPKKRLWRGSVVSPYGANTKVILYKCSSSEDVKSDGAKNFLVQVLHNERPMTLPACDGAHFCPFEVFKERVVWPHLKHSYDSICTVSAGDTNCSWSCQLWKLGSSFFGFLKQNGHFSASNEANTEL